MSIIVAACYEDIEFSGNVLRIVKNIREAIEVTYHTEVEYIWIDSLRVIQDFPQNMAYEAALMHLVYSIAIMNIYPDDAQDGTEGLFRERNPGLCRSLEVEVSWKGLERRNHAALRLTYYSL